MDDDDEILLYEAEMPVIKLTTAYWDKHIKPWLENKPKSGEYNWPYAYWPSYGIIRTSIFKGNSFGKISRKPGEKWRITNHEWFTCNERLESIGPHGLMLLAVE